MMPLERLTALLRLAGVDPDTGEKLTDPGAASRVSAEYLAALASAREARGALERTIAAYGCAVVKARTHKRTEDK